MSIPKQDERTPGPWTVNPSRMSDVIGSNCETIALCFGAGNEAPANAEFIVSAVNAYDSTEALRSALADELVWHEAAEKALSKQPPSGDRGWRRAEHQERIDAIRAALSASPDNDRHHSENDNARLRDALWQLLDDMGDDGLSVCQAAKDQARAALSGSPAPSAEGLREALRKIDAECHSQTGGNDVHSDLLEYISNLARAALSGSPAPSTEGLRGWLPIETAPRDGSQVLLFWPFITQDGLVTSGNWYEPHDADPYWYSGLANSGATPPTYWMPLPPAPDAARTALAGVTAPQTATEGK